MGQPVIGNEIEKKKKIKKSSNKQTWDQMKLYDLQPHGRI